MNLNELYSDIIREHSISAHNKHHLGTPSIVVPGNNPTCGDEIELELERDNSIIKDASFTGIGCAVSRASVSIMIDLVRGKTLEEARELALIFLAMLRREELDEESMERLEEAAALQNVANMPARVKCATMPWHTLLKAIEQLEAANFHYYRRN